MAKIYFTLMVVFMVLISRGVNGSKTDAPESDGGRWSPAESPEEGNIEACAEAFDIECANAIFSNIFLKARKVVTANCCEQLVEAGRQCHDSLVNKVLRFSPYKGKESIYVPKSVQIWEFCAKSTKN
jgi:hypothetical protein